MRKPILLPFVLMLPLLLALLGCKEGNPVAPPGTVLTISASPSKIDLNGSAQITVIGRKGDGNPLSSGTEIRLASSLGVIQSVVATDASGVARATLQADSRSGNAEVSATTGDGTAMATITVQVGESTETRPTVLVSASPNNIPVEGTAEVTIIARNSDGTPVAAGLTVILTTTLGSLQPDRPQTGNDGTARSTLNAGNQAGTATIRAILGASEPATAEVTIRDAATDISLQANPSSIARSDATISLSAFVTNSQGSPLQGAPVTFESDIGTLTVTGVVFTNTNGVATNTLTVAQGDIAPTRTAFQVRARTPDGTGQLLQASTTIQIQ